MSGLLLRMVRQLLESLLSQLAQQLTAIHEAVLGPIRLMMQQVLGGIWIGDGANAFVDELSSLIIPSITQIGDDISQYSSDLGSARDMIDQADQEVAQLVQSRLADSFEFF